MLNIFNNHMSSSGLSFEGAGQSFDAINSLPQATQDALRDRAKSGIVLAFFAITAFMWLGSLFMLGLGNVYIGKDRGDMVGEDAMPENVVKGTYIGSLLRRKDGTRV